jgi:hypothetical protein
VVSEKRADLKGLGGFPRSFCAAIGAPPASAKNQKIA